MSARAALFAGRRALMAACGHAPRRRAAVSFARALTALVLLAAVASLALGAVAYRALRQAGDASANARLSSALVANTVRGADRVGAVASADGPEGPALVLVSDSAGVTFETRLYLEDGRLMRGYALAGTPFDPASATPVARTSTFSFSVDDGLLTVSTDDGEHVVALRSGPVSRGGEGS